MNNDLKKIVKFLIYKNLFENVVLYHGSNNNFQNFSLNRIGTGDGGNLFGSGFYLTDNEKVAQHYAKKVSKKKYITGYNFQGILGTEEPIYHKDADDLASKDMKINKFYVKGNFLEAENYIISDKFKEEIINLMIKHSGFGKEAHEIVERTFNFLRNNKDKINKYRGELEYIIQHLAMGNEKIIEGIKEYIIKMGYDGIKYPSDPSYEGSGSYNYVIYNNKVIKKPFNK